MPKIYSEDKRSINVIIETPYKSRNKFAYQPETGLYLLKKVLPAGLSFPCDMGFIPNTEGDDGDPLDALILMDELTFPGCVVECRLIGVIKAIQKEKNRKPVSNDRYVFVPKQMTDSDHIKKMVDINKNKLESIINFFTNYNQFEGKEFIVEKIFNAPVANKLIKKFAKK